MSTSSLPSFGQAGSPPPQNSGPVFNLAGTYANGHQSPPPQSISAPPTQQRLPQTKLRADEEHAHLASLFANRDDTGIDTFGNFGQLRYVSTMPRGMQSLIPRMIGMVSRLVDS